MKEQLSPEVPEVINIQLAAVEATIADLKRQLHRERKLRRELLRELQEANQVIEYYEAHQETDFEREKFEEEIRHQAAQ